jgi:myb proto-oncogene protein
MLTELNLNKRSMLPADSPQALKRHCNGLNEPPNTSSSNRKFAPRRWTPAEDAQLSAAIAKHGARNWKGVAAMVPGRSHAQCLQRWAKVLKPGLRKGQWTNEEDTALLSLVQSGWAGSNWSMIAGEIAGRTSKQCRERWFHHLDPAINRSAYTAEEDALILAEHDRRGGRWAAIARLMQGRTGEAVKIRFKTLDRHRKSGSTARCPQISRCRQFVLCSPDVAAPAASSTISPLGVPASLRSLRQPKPAAAPVEQAKQQPQPPVKVGREQGELDWIAAMLEEVERDASAPLDIDIDIGDIDIAIGNGCGGDGGDDGDDGDDGSGIAFDDLEWGGIAEQITVADLLCVSEDKPRKDEPPASGAVDDLMVSLFDCDGTLC